MHIIQLINNNRNETKLHWTEEPLITGLLGVLTPVPIICANSNCEMHLSTWNLHWNFFGNDCIKQQKTKDYD